MNTSTCPMNVNNDDDRFIVSRPLSGQAWNAYSYVLNNPLNYVDPSGFDPYYIDSNGVAVFPNAPPLNVCVGKCDDPPPDKTVQGTREAVQAGATTRPVDVSTTGSAAGHVPQSAAALAAGPSASHVGVQIGVGIVK